MAPHDKRESNIEMISEWQLLKNKKANSEWKLHSW